MSKKNIELIQVLSDISNVAGRMARRMKLIDRFIKLEGRENNTPIKEGVDYYVKRRRSADGHC